MKKFKRALLRPAYAAYWLWMKFIIHTGPPVRFNRWLSRNGFWMLENTLDNFKVIVPKEYREFVKNNPNITFRDTLKKIHLMNTSHIPIKRR